MFSLHTGVDKKKNNEANIDFMSQILLHAKTPEYTVYKLLINFIDQNKMKIKSIFNN